MEILDIVDENGIPTGETVERKKAHREGIPHRTAHVWIMKEGTNLILLQKRSADKDSYPGCLDISSAGHIPAGCEVVDSAIRELQEELGISVSPGQLHFCGKRKFSFCDTFHGRIFRDRQVSSVFLVWLDIEKDEMRLQKEEIEDVVWMDFEECVRMVKENTGKHCIAMEELEMLRAYMQNEDKGKLLR